MIIKFEYNTFLYDLFPVSSNDDVEELKNKIKDFYTIDGIEPKVKLNDNEVEISIDTALITKNESSFNRLIDLAQSGNYSKAKDYARKLIEESPQVSEYHRILGQIYSDEGNNDEAVNSLIDSLRWNPNNEYALLMMGNVFARGKNDIDTAMTYYYEVLNKNPKDNIALNNIGANLMQQGKEKEAVDFFYKAIEIDPEYPNTHYALALTYEQKNEYEKSFYYSLSALEVNSKKDELYNNSLKLAIESAKKLKQEINAFNFINDIVGDLYKRTGKKIEIIQDEDIETAAKIEFAENYKRDYHLVKYRSSYPAVEHLVLHELLHLKFTTDAREANNNELFISNEKHKKYFLDSLNVFYKKMYNKGIPDEKLKSYLESLFFGLNRQIYNTPIDLFIEDYIYNNYKEIRPFQFLSLLVLLQEGLSATTKKDVIDNSPSSIISVSKTYNLISALHFKELYKVDLVKEHNPSRLELNRAKEFFKEFNEYRQNKKPGEEFELVLFWAEDLEVDNYFELVLEQDYYKDIDHKVSEIESDLTNFDPNDPSQERKMTKFLEEHSSEDINTAVAMYMVDALNYFDDMDKSDIKKIAFEFASFGMNGIDPKKDGYKVSSINRSFSGYHTLAYYYVSWALAVPEMLKELKLPFEKEYELALSLKSK